MYMNQIAKPVILLQWSGASYTGVKVYFGNKTDRIGIWRVGESEFIFLSMA